MRRGYWYLCLFAILMAVIGCGVGSVLAGEGIPKYRKNAEVGTPSDAEVGTPSDAEIGTPSDAEVGTPSDANSDEIVLLMDIPDEGCRTQEELVEQLLDDSQDRIELASDIMWTEKHEIAVSVEKEVDMGEYRILVGAESGFDVSGPVTFRGGGSHPLFEVKGYFCPGKGVEIHAIGDNVVAVDIIDGNWAAEFVEIHADGRNARAVRFTGLREQTVDICQIDAEGEGSRGIEAEGDLRLFLSSVSGEEEAVSSEHGKLLLFGSRVSPEPKQARVLPALFVPYNRLEENGFCVAVGESQEALREEIEEHKTIEWQFFSEGRELRCVYWLPVAWSGIPTNLSMPGTYFARCTPVDIPEWFPAEISDIEVPVHIVDPDRPFIMDAQDAGLAALLRFFTPIREAREIRVEYSADDRENWKDIEEFPDSFVTETVANAGPLKPMQDYWFRLVVKGGPMEGISNEILFIGDEVRKVNGGGDRDHGDRGDQGENPPHREIIPPSDTEGVDAIKPDAVKPSAGASDVMILDVVKTDTPELDEAVQNHQQPETEKQHERSMDESTSTDKVDHSSDPVTALPDSEIWKASGDVPGDGLQEVSRIPWMRWSWVLIPGILVLGGGIYVFWKKWNRNN